MLFSSSVFLFVFLPVVLAVYYGPLRFWRGAQNVWLLVASLFFYAWGEPWFVLVMIGSILVNWTFALLVDRLRERRAAARAVLTVMLVCNLSVLFVFKYLMFTLSAVNRLFGASLAVPTILLPIGISFFTFQAVSYVIDVYRGDGAVQKNPLNVGLYIAFFPQLIAGPIVRYETVAEQIKNRRETFSDFSAGVCRFIVGLSKKVLLSNNLALCADAAFAAGSGELSTAMAWLGAAAYTLQIYFDFSGYSDMAIGLGKMFGFHFLENFDYPYISKSVSEFWRRWHISLGTYFRDYVYFPLGGSRVKSRGRLVFNLFVVWSLTGLWHGAAWTFVLWGLYYFALITLEKLTGLDRLLAKSRVLGHVSTLLAVVFGWVLFRAPGVRAAGEYVLAMLGLAGGPAVDATAILWLSESAWCLVLGILLSAPLARWLSERTARSRLAAIGYPIAMTAMFLIAVSYLVKGVYNPFIYFNF
ncbi:MBOAT family O-acyltransferase [Feifania hominis]|uniref:MBOAT family protein n=1 Tax=Feifania hominis TaxID=2763660 RepID=A0A926DBB9_9FIRM|nr:MBOAT family protein [Feifania hominis]MBC8535388.1 MBOAT family protein [Feifania hominis]